MSRTLHLTLKVKQHVEKLQAELDTLPEEENAENDINSEVNCSSQSISSQDHATQL